MKKTILKIGVLILSFSLMGAFVLYKMDFFKSKNNHKEQKSNQIMPSSKMGNVVDDSAFREMIKEEGFEFSIDQYEEELHEGNIIHSTKSLGGNSGIRIQDFVGEDKVFADSSKSRRTFKDNDFKEIEKGLKIETKMSSSKSIILMEPEPLPIPEYKVKFPLDTARKLKIGTSNP